jgi:hypothetical protein
VYYRIVGIVRVRGLVLTTCYRGVLGLMLHGRADNTVCGGGMSAVPIRGEVRGSVTKSRWEVALGMMEVGFIGIPRGGEEMTGI